MQCEDEVDTLHEYDSKRVRLSTGMYYNIILCLYNAAQVFFGGSLLFVLLVSLQRPSSCPQKHYCICLKTISA